MVELVHRSADRMAMRVDQPRQHAPALKIDAARIRSGQFQDGFAAADGQQPLAADRHRLGDPELRIDRHDAAVVQNNLRRLCTGNRGKQQEPSGQQQSHRSEHHRTPRHRDIG
jgi:hypothetical protein